MPDNSGRFSQKRRGVSAGDPLAALRSRVDAGMTDQLTASSHLDEVLFNAALSRQHPWASHPTAQAITLQWWLVQMYWQCAGAYFAQMDQRKVPAVPETLDQCERLCNAAEGLMIEVIKNQSLADVGTIESLTERQRLPALGITEQTCQAVWAVCEAVALQVQTDMGRVLSQLPPRFRPAAQSLQQAMQPNAALFEHFQRNWLGAMVPSAQMDIVGRALEPVRAIFEVGQQIWAPYLLGAIYATCMRQKPTLEDLELGFDPWIITDPGARRRYEHDATAVKELQQFWAKNPRPAQAQALQQEIEAAHNRRQIRLMDGRTLPYCPWTSVWVAWRSVTIGGVELSMGMLFALYTGLNADEVFVNEIRRAGTFRLEISGMH